MSNCQITIEFDRTDRTYCGGETVRGQVHVQASQSITVKDVTLTRNWKTHGKCPKEFGLKAEEVLGHPGPMQAGETWSCDFAFVPKPIPLTYEGYLIHIDHFVCVDVNVAWGSDGKVEQFFNLVPGRLTRQELDKPREVEVAPPYSWVLGGLIMVLSVFALIALVADGWRIIGPLILIGCVYQQVRKRMLFSRLGEVQLKTPNLTVHSDEQWPVSLRFKPPKDLSINGLQATVRCVEKAGSGEHSRSHTVYEKVHVIKRAGRLPGGSAYRKTLKIPFPDSKAFSFKGLHNSVTWTVEFLLDLPGYPDWQQTETVEFLPAHAESV